MEDHQDRDGRQNPRSDLKTAGRERSKRTRILLRRHPIDFLVGALSGNVFGTGVATAFCDGPIILPIPADAADLTAPGWADAVHRFQPALAQSLGLAAAAMPESRVAGRMNLYGGGMARFIGAAFRLSVLIPADVGQSHEEPSRYALRLRVRVCMSGPSLPLWMTRRIDL